MSAGVLSLAPWPVWVLAVAGWAVVAGGLWRWPAGTRRRAALTVHTLTPFGLVLFCSLVGLGLLHAIASATAGWWALAAVTGLRPGRLLDPAGAAAGRLAAWFVMTAALAHATRWLLF